MSTPTKSIDIVERNLISNALGLQAASFKRAINAAIQAKDEVLQAHYQKQFDMTNALIAKVNNLELF